MGAQKISVTVDEDVLAAARKLAPRGNLSAFVNEAVAARVRHEKAREWLAEREAELGPIPDEVREDVRRRWLD